jgi:hypothetical protein
MADEKTLTMNEFKMWLTGVEEMQPADWTPDASQWKKIREKLNLVIETQYNSTQYNSTQVAYGPTPGLAGLAAPLDPVQPVRYIDAPGGLNDFQLPPSVVSNPAPPSNGLFNNEGGRFKRLPTTICLTCLRI